MKQKTKIQSVINTNTYSFTIHEQPSDKINRLYEDKCIIFSPLIVYLLVMVPAHFVLKAIGFGLLIPDRLVKSFMTTFARDKCIFINK